MENWLKTEWFKLINTYSLNEEVNNQLWNDLVNNYSSKSRFYNNLSHIYSMLKQASQIEDELTNVDAFKFAIWFHDVIYKSTKKDNEEKSAAFASKKLALLNIKPQGITRVSNLIISTKKHELIVEDNIDNAYLLDIDLSILGSNWETYKTYISNIRKEYKMYPDFFIQSRTKKGFKSVLRKRFTLFYRKI